MFDGCNSLINLNLSNFNTQNVTDMSYMFHKCSSLTNLNLSNFNTQNVTDMTCMFRKCSSLKKENILTKDDKVINQFLSKEKEEENSSLSLVSMLALWNPKD